MIFAGTLAWFHILTCDPGAVATVARQAESEAAQRIFCPLNTLPLPNWGDPAP
jgi:hypothetical protein